MKDSNTNRSLRLVRLEEILRSPIVSNSSLKELTWLGIPPEATPGLRSVTWKLLLGYFPLEQHRRTESVRRKEEEYRKLRESYCKNSAENESNHSMTHEKQLKQIRADLARTKPSGYADLFSHVCIHDMMEHILLVWAIRNPASGYVQGLNDLMTPLIVVFLEETLNSHCFTPEHISNLTSSSTISVEAACYWCFSKILSQVQDNYVFGQPGVVRMIHGVEAILKRADATLFSHLNHHNIELLQLCFRWMNCFLIRELPLNSAIRLWDTYIAEGTTGFSEFHIYVSAAFLMLWSHQIKEMDYQQILLFIQSPPTETWTVIDIESLVAHAFVWKSLFHSSPRHLISS